MTEKEITDNIMFWGSVAFIVYMFGLGFTSSLDPYYNALIAYTGGGWPVVEEAYESLSLAFKLWLAK